ncbi:hypothetical protein EJB05_35354, partial [Eragrostis curvula]
METAGENSLACGGRSADGRFSYGFASSPGKRPSMEDFYETKTYQSESGETVGLFSVYDGHGGARAAEYVKQNFFTNLIKHPKFISDTKSAIAETYSHTDLEFLKADSSQTQDAGLSASTAIIMGDHLIIANVGDSRAIICKGGEGTWRVGGVLAVSQAFGDKLLKQYVVADSDIKKAHIPNAPLEIKVAHTDLAVAYTLSDCIKDCNDIKRSIDEHGFSVEQKATELFDVMSNLQNKFTSQHNVVETLREKLSGLQSEMKEKDKEIISMQRNMSLLYETCTSSVAKIEAMSDVCPGNRSYEECIKLIVDQLVASQNSKDGRIKELTNELSRKDQEIDSLMQALDEEEKELEVLENKSNHLDQLLQEKEFTLKSLEVSRTKALAKLAMTVEKFDELHSLSESLLAEVENLQTQLQERDAEVTRSTNELLTTEESNKKYLSQINDFIKWLEKTLLRFGMHCKSIDDYDCTQVPVYMDMLDNKIASLIVESDDLRVKAQNKDFSLQVERAKTEELLRKLEALEVSLSQKDSQIGLLRRDNTSNQPSRSIYLPGTSEIEQMNDKVSSAVAVTQIQVNNDQVAIDVDMEEDKPLDEDDDKAHGFKSLTMSQFVSKFTRPVSDRIDGMWVSGDRLLMR